MKSYINISVLAIVLILVSGVCLAAGNTLKTVRRYQRKELFMLIFMQTNHVIPVMTATPL